MTTKVIGKTQCPNCKAKGGDKSKDNLILYADGGSYCFACGHTKAGNKTKPIITIEEQSLRPMPEDIMPLAEHNAGYYWLKQYLDIPPNNLLWSSGQQWLIFPYIMDDNLFAWQARNFSGHGPKWLTFGSVIDNIYIVGDKSKPPVLVEDIVSALKIKAAGGSAIPLFGCTIGLKRIKKLMELFKVVFLWLDPDKKKETVLEAHQAFKLGLEIRIILSDADPKEHTIDYIQDKILTDKT